MKTRFLAVASLFLLALGACKKESNQGIDRPVSASRSTLPAGGTLPNVVAAGDTLVLSGGGVSGCAEYILNGKCYIDSLAVIEIGAGSVIRGVRYQNNDSASALVVCRGGKIFARGTETNPVIFTGSVNDNQPGAWGGVVILGNADANKINPSIEGVQLPTLPIGVNVGYGPVPNGSGGKIFNNSDNSGVFQFVKIFYAGARIAADNELNGLTLGGVGSGTTMDHIYVAFGADDGFEFFGGNVNAKYLIARSSNDDQFDFDFGFTGNIQYALAYLDQSGVVYNADANGIECDNDANSSGDQPLTNPHISNLTVVGGNTAAVTGSLYGSRWRRNTSATVHNSIFMGYNPSVFFNAAPQAPNAGIVVCDNVIHSFSAVPAAVAACSQVYTTGATSNDSLRLVRPFGVTCGTALNQIDLRPNTTTSPARNGAVWTWSPAGFFTQVTYRGAFDPAGTTRQWMAWVCNGCN